MANTYLIPSHEACKTVHVQSGQVEPEFMENEFCEEVKSEPVYDEIGDSLDHSLLPDDQRSETDEPHEHHCEGHVDSCVTIASVTGTLPSGISHPLKLVRGPYPHSGKCRILDPWCKDFKDEMFIRVLMLAEEYGDMLRNPRSLYSRNCLQSMSVPVCEACGCVLQHSANLFQVLLAHFRKYHPQDMQELTLRACDKYASSLHLMHTNLQLDIDYITLVHYNQ